ncbi:MAG: hypothetical protein K8H85_00025 [Cyclobacteriaceae bacterium]|nr:hypothetical protein [Cyclobacteriaceae bacterium]
MTKFEHHHDILQRSISDLEVSESFRLDFRKAGFDTLQKALAFDADTLVKEKNISYHTITELIELLRSKNLTHLFRE